ECQEPALRSVLSRTAEALHDQGDGEALAASLDWPRSGPSGFVLHTVPAILWARLSEQPELPTAQNTTRRDGSPTAQAEGADRMLSVGSLGSRLGLPTATEEPHRSAGRSEQSVRSGLTEPMRHGIERALSLGGDADSTAAVVGALTGCSGGSAVVPGDWRDGLWEWPRGERWMRRAAATLAKSPAHTPPQRTAATCSLHVPPGAVPLRNGVFLTVVLAHALRRLAPPW
ncbi:MAG: ADP-ribosylglycohydrolase family protein, partial [Planctomycetota bacterium]